METPTQFKKRVIAGIREGKKPFWCGCEIEEIDFGTITIGGKLDIILESGKTIEVDMNEIDLK